MFFVAVVLLLSAAGQKADKQPYQSEFNNELSYADEKASLKEGLLVYTPNYDTTGLNEMEVLLYTEGVNIFDDEEGFPDSINGDGFMLYFALYTLDSTHLSPGEYSLQELRQNFGISDASIAIVSNADIESEMEMYSCEFELEIEEGVYTLVGKAKDKEGEKVKFQYQGRLRYYKDQ